MRAINITAQKIMDELTIGIGPGCRHRKIDNAGGVYMAVVIEEIGNAQFGQRGVVQLRNPMSIRR